MLRHLPDYQDDVGQLRPFANIKLVALDLDGTLSPGPLDEKVQDAMRSLTHYGVRTTLATGRTYFGVRSMCKRLGIRTGTPLILYNGSIVVKYGHERLLRRAVIPRETLMDVLQVMTPFSCEVFAYYCQDKTTMLSPDGLLQEQVFGWNFGKDITGRTEREFNGGTISWQERIESTHIDRPSAILIRIRQPSLSDHLAELLSKISTLSVTRSGPLYIELRPVGSDKSIGLKCAAEQFGLDQTQILALGDNDNDAEMLSWSGIGVAIAGASIDALANADYICRGETFAGAVELLNVIKYAHRYFSEKTRNHH